MLGRRFNDLGGYMNTRYSIGQISKLFNISTFTIRFYEKKGLISPEIDRNNSYRYYSHRHIRQIKAVLLLKNIGLSIEEISNIIGTTDKDKIETILNEKMMQIDEKIIEFKKWREALINLENRMKVANNMKGKLKVINSDENIIIATFNSKEYLKYADLICSDITKHMIYINKEDLFNSNFVNSIKFAVEITKDNLFHFYKQNISYEYHIIEKNKQKEYLFTHFVTNYECEPMEFIEKTKSWLKTNGREADSDVICRFICTQGKEDIYDLYEAWILLKDK